MKTYLEAIIMRIDTSLRRDDETKSECEALKFYCLLVLDRTYRFCLFS